ncbi:MAG TPA: tRNA (adenosine(37)-N6)-threonylcarbamoyltransferase complex transferase subunit TsaD [Methylomirabilota bacterium]|nr:tRNA (adenosine(37)-N6)-threonylcarbamoyltransferase complex transferase subunit TsaD [Methylomirabilota bacterium]
MIILAFETSCDETSVAVARDGVVLSNVVSSQIRLHAEYGGVVPELATREHLRHLLPVARTALREAGVSPAAVTAVAATRGPGLPNALMIGLKTAQAVAFALRRPFLGVHHHEAHLYSPWVTGAPLREDFGAFHPHVSLIVSGGHTLLVHVRGEFEHHLLGGTLDDAAGECFDKVAKLIGLPYPGGPEMDRLAAEGHPAAYDFPRPLLRDEGDDFSFAGLKTSVRYFVEKHPALLCEPARVRDLCASVQAAIVEVLVAKTIRAARRLDVKVVTASGGVTCNRALRRLLNEECRRAGLALRLAPTELCTDNAAMIALVAGRRLARFGPPPGSFDIDPAPAWDLADTAQPAGGQP